MGRGAPLTAAEQRDVMKQQAVGTRFHIEDLRENTTTENYLRQMPRRWRIGDVYAPHDMSPSEMRKWRHTAANANVDVLDLMGINPLDNYKVASPLFSLFLS